MTQDLKTPIPPMSEEDRSLRAEFEREWLKNSLAAMKSKETGPAELCSLMHHYCQLKKEDNAKDKNFVHLAIAQARLSRRPHSLPLPLRERAGVRVTTADPGGAQSAIEDIEPEPDDSDNSRFAIDNSEFDPDVDLEWSLAPWGRRKNGKPRSEKEYRTILYRTVRDVYGLDLNEDPAKHRPDRISEPSSTPDALPPSNTATSTINHPTSDIPHSTSDIPPPRPPPGKTDVSPFCRPDAPFVPKVANPWYYF